MKFADWSEPTRHRVPDAFKPLLRSIQALGLSRGGFRVLEFPCRAQLPDGSWIERAEIRLCDGIPSTGDPNARSIEEIVRIEPSRFTLSPRLRRFFAAGLDQFEVVDGNGDLWTAIDRLSMALEDQSECSPGRLRIPTGEDFISGHRRGRLPLPRLTTVHGKYEPDLDTPETVLEPLDLSELR